MLEPVRVPGLELGHELGLELGLAACLELRLAVVAGRLARAIW